MVHEMVILTGDYLLIINIAVFQEVLACNLFHMTSVWLCILSRVTGTIQTWNNNYTYMLNSKIRYSQEEQSL